MHISCADLQRFARAVLARWGNSNLAQVRSSLGDAPPPNDLSHLSDDEFQALCPQGYHGVGDDGPAVSEGREPVSVNQQAAMDDLAVGELVSRLRTKAATEKRNACHYSAILLTRAADLLERLGTPQPESPAEALATRPLLEEVAKLGDVIDKATVGRVLKLATSAKFWLQNNPPGQPIAIEPRGCPAPGACGCVVPALPPPSGEVEK